MTQSPERFRVCVDTGGTFTDCVVMSNSGILSEYKSPSTPPDFSIGVLNALQEASTGLGIAHDEFISRIDLIVHGTTAATNALVTRNVARTALVTSNGFRDIIEIRRSQKIETRSMYEAYIPPYEPIVPRRHRFVVHERINSSGEIQEPLQRSEVESLAQSLVSERIEAVSICLINSYANTEHEERLKDWLQELLPEDVFVTSSTELLPKLGEYERESTSIISACLGPIVRSYLKNLESALLEGGFSGDLLIMQANQYAQSVKAVTQKPAYLMGSGPAAAPAGAAMLGEVIGVNNLITADMGGTTLDVSVVTGGQVKLANGQWIEDDRLGLKVVDVCSIAAGGGSIAWVDTLGLLKVGPQSAGAEPGPACFGKGGEEPTVTDAAVILGYMEPDAFWAGKLKLDVDRAREAIAKLAEKLSLSTEETALAIFDVVSSVMGDGTAEVTTKQGKDVRDYSLLGIGGAGPLCVGMIADKLNINRVIIPRFSSSFSAWSMFSLDVGRDFLLALPENLKNLDPRNVESQFENLRRKAREDLKGLADDDAEIVFEMSADLRYSGQYHELEVPIEASPFNAEAIELLASNFALLHKQMFTFDLPDADILLRTLRLIAKVKTPKVSFVKAQQRSGPIPARRSRRAYFSGGWTKAEVFDLDAVCQGDPISGPAIGEGLTTTLVVPPGFAGTVDSYGNIILERKESSQ